MKPLLNWLCGWLTFGWWMARLTVRALLGMEIE